MSTTAGYRPLPSPGMYTSPTRLTPSLAEIVTLESFVMPAALADEARASTASRQSPSTPRRTATQRGGGRQLLTGGRLAGWLAPADRAVGCNDPGVMREVPVPKAGPPLEVASFLACLATL